MLPALIGAGASIIGGLLGKSAAKSQAEYQKKFAKMGIQWRVADAKKAGIHPLFAMNANLPTYQPVDQSWTNSFSAAGQDLARAADQFTTRSERSSNAVYEKTLRGLQLERASLENDHLRSQIAINNRTGSAPPLADGSAVIAGQNDSPGGFRIPFTNYIVPYDDPQYSQKVQDAGGDIAENVLGPGYMAESIGRAIYNSAVDASTWLGWPQPRSAKFYPYILEDPKTGRRRIIRQ